MCLKEPGGWVISLESIVCSWLLSMNQKGRKDKVLSSEPYHNPPPPTHTLSISLTVVERTPFFVGSKLSCKVIRLRIHNTMENVELHGETYKATQHSCAATCVSKTTDNALNHKVSDDCQITKRQQKPVEIQASAREECVLMY